MVGGVIRRPPRSVPFLRGNPANAEHIGACRKNAAAAELPAVLDKACSALVQSRERGMALVANPAPPAPKKDTPCFSRPPRDCPAA
jgi:hypothetical protein